jgi:hypothetical protein
MTSTAKVAKRSNRGSKPGERRGGRVKGQPNKATAAIKDIAREYTDEAVKALVAVLKGGDGIPAAAQVAAAKEILDRGYGKATQIIGGDEEHPLRTIQEIALVGPKG